MRLTRHFVERARTHALGQRDAVTWGQRHRLDLE
jgi:hypothetical protein